MNKEFEKICRMSQKSLKNHLKQKLCTEYGNVIVGDGYYTQKGIFLCCL